MGGAELCGARERLLLRLRELRFLGAKREPRPNLRLDISGFGEFDGGSVYRAAAMSACGMCFRCVVIVEQLLNSGAVIASGMN